MTLAGIPTGGTIYERVQGLRAPRYVAASRAGARVPPK